MTDTRKQGHQQPNQDAPDHGLRAFDARHAICVLDLSSELRLKLIADAGTPDRVATAQELLAHVAAELTRGESVDSVFDFGYWRLKLHALSDESEPVRQFEVWERKPDTTDYHKGVSHAVDCWTAQHEACARHNATFVPPSPDQYAAVSTGVFQGLDITGLRYPSPPHMSGWWITADDYDGDVAALRVEHLYHVTAARPELVRFLALPEGFRFDLRGRESVRFDPRVLED